MSATTASSTNVTDDTLKKRKVQEISNSNSDKTLSSEFVNLLLSTKSDQLLDGFPDNRLYIANRNDLVCDVFKGLIHHKFTSVPVLIKNGKYYGFIDLFDIVLCVMNFFGKEKLTNSEDFWKLIEKEELFRKKTVNDLMVAPLSKRNPFRPAYKGYSLFSVVESLGREPNLHRVPIITSDFQLLSIITQSQVNKFFYKNIHQMGSKKDIRVRDMTKSDFAITVSTEDDAITAFKKMIDYEVTGLPVVNKEGKLVDNLSISDLKAIAADSRLFWRLYQTVESFLQKVKAEYKERPKKPVFLTPDDTLETAIKLLAENNIHRVYIVNEKSEPTGVIAIRDVILEIIDI